MLKNKVWVLSPVFFIVPIFILLMAFVSLHWSFNLFLLQIAVAVLSFILIFLEIYKFKMYINSNLKYAEKHFKSINADYLSKFPFAAVIIGEKNDIIAVNQYFRRTIGQNKNFIGSSFSDLISGKNISDIANDSVFDTTYAGKQYTVFAIPLKKNSIVCFIDDTYYKETAFEYTQSRPAVCLAVFDNRDEISTNNKGGYDTQIVAQVEYELQNFSNDTSGFMKKLNNNRYMIIMEERHIKTFIETKFSVLEKVRKIKIDGRQSATISMGIGRMARTLNESEKWAQKALDMALGRGGDQVAIRQDESYQFFGGKSKGIEKRDKVRTRVIAATLTEYASSSDRVLIMGHKFSDLDSIGSALGLCGAINKALKTSAYIVVDHESSLALPVINMVKNKYEQRIFVSPGNARNMVTDKTLLIIVDTHSENFLEDKKLYERCNNIVVIDHHRMMVDHIKNAVIFYHEPYASSASEMVTELVQYIGDNTIDDVEAEALLAGIMLDTKNFVLKTGVRTFEAAAFLKRKGADTVEVKKFFSDSLSTYRERAALVSNADIVKNSAVTYTTKTSKYTRLACAQAADELLTIQGVSASYVIYPSKGAVSISARSLGDVNVQLVMEQLGGGGHQTMAGVQIKDAELMSVRRQLLDVIQKMSSE